MFSTLSVYNRYYIYLQAPLQRKEHLPRPPQDLNHRPRKATRKYAPHPALLLQRQNHK